MTGAQQAACWAWLDAYVTDQIVPWVVLGANTDVIRLLSDRIVAYSFDQARGWPSWDRIVLAPEREGSS
jgi:hypothetical protein